ncbi:hypothetical protein G6F71_007267 [Rhizopus microsporus]|nr:hypothetical protein G6F71_007267 [Rhizopus microsporus]
MPIININDNITTRFIPEYDDEVTTIRFVNKAGFKEWFNNIAQKHTNWSLHQSWSNEKKKKQNLFLVNLLHPL